MAKQEVSVEVIQHEISPVVRQAAVMEIKNGNDMKKATETLSLLNKNLDTVTDHKEKLTKPLNAALKEIRERYKPVENWLGETIEGLRGKMTVYQTNEKARADAEALRIAERVKEGKGNLKVETAVRKIGEIDTPDEKVIADSGTVKFQTMKKFQVMDVTMLPVAYLLADEVKIRKAMKEGIELPGVRYYSEEVPINNR